MNDQTKGSIFTISGFAAIVVGWVTIVNGGWLVSLDRFIIWTYTVPQFITMLLIGVGGAILVFEVTLLH